MFVHRCVTLFTFLVLSIGCDNGFRPTTPSPLPTQPAPAVPPPVAGIIDGSTYRFSGSLAYPISGYTSESTYVLDDHGRFLLQYPFQSGNYPGSYRQDNGVLSFQFDGDVRWQATGTLTGDLMAVRYNLLMHLTDFENAAYTRSR
jgi:hypothetical protein